jgi:uncharacterized LabA/DUF88 family protein
MCMAFIPFSPLDHLIHGRVAVFIDASNVFYAQKALGWTVDFKKIADHLESFSTDMQLHFYTAKDSGRSTQMAFLRKLKLYGYNIHEKEIKILRNRSGIRTATKGNLDVELALDAYRLKDTFDDFILFSGDSDFAYLLDLLKENAKNVIVISVREHVSRELLERAKYIELRKLKELFLNSKKPE